MGLLYFTLLTTYRKIRFKLGLNVIDFQSVFGCVAPSIRLSTLISAAQLTLVL